MSSSPPVWITASQYSSSQSSLHIADAMNSCSILFYSLALAHTENNLDVNVGINDRSWLEGEE